MSALGYEVRRGYDPKTLKAFSNKPSAGKILEFIGPSAVGKSTLFYSVTDELEKDWFLPHHATSLSDIAFDGTKSYFDVHRQLLLERVARISRNEKDFWTFATSIGYGSRVAKMDILMRRDFPRGFALDEGMFQVFSGDFHTLKNDDLEKIYSGRSLVFMSAREADTIAKRKMVRYEQMLSTGHLPRTTNYADMLARSESSIKHFSSFAENAKKFGADIITIFAEDSDHENRQTVLEFSKTINRS